MEPKKNRIRNIYLKLVLDGKVKSIFSHLTFKLINVYGPTQNIHKAELWKDIENWINSINNDFYIVGGDFNTKLDHSDKYGCSNFISQAQRDFGDWVSIINLMEDIRSSNGTFTWNNRRSSFSYIEERLDRFFFKGDIGVFNHTLSSLNLFGIKSFFNLP